MILNGLEIYFYFNNPEIKNLNHKYIINIEEYANNKRESIRNNQDDIMESIYVQQMIIKGIEQLDKGEFISHEDAKERFREGLK